MIRRKYNNPDGHDGDAPSRGYRSNPRDIQSRMVSCVYGTNASGYAYRADRFRRRSLVNGTTIDFAMNGQFFVRETQAGARYATCLTEPRGHFIAGMRQERP